MSTYSPKIYEDLIPVLYRLAKIKGMTMTRLVNRILVTELLNSRHLTYEDSTALTMKGGKR